MEQKGPELLPLTRGGGRLVVASNRLPVVLERTEGDGSVAPGSGGLVTAMSPILHQHGGCWVGWPGTVDAGREGLEGLHYAGSHGLDVRGPDGYRLRQGEEHLTALDAAEEELRAGLADVPGADVERKRYGVAVHWRRAPGERVEAIRRRARRVAGRDPRLTLVPGRKVAELRPSVDWDKGRALLLLLERMGLEPGADAALYVGDDVTDEDAFRALRSEAGDRGVGVVVRGETDGRSTLADFALEGPGAVRRFLAAVVGPPCRGPATDR